MLSEKQLREICDNFSTYYQQVGTKLLMEVARKAALDAEKNYKKLPKHRSRSLFAYVSFWVWNAVIFDTYGLGIQQKIREIEDKNEIIKEADRNNFAAQVEYFNVIEPEKDENSISTTQNVPDLWQKLDKRIPVDSESAILGDLMPLFEELGPKYVKMIKAFNKSAEVRGQKSRIDNYLQSKASKANYRYFLKNKERVIKYCQEQLPDIEVPNWFYSQFNNQQTYSFLSLLPDFPKLIFPKDILNLAAQEYPILGEFKDRVKVELADRDSNAYYVKETDSFEIIVNQKNDHRKKVTELIYGLSKVIGDLEDFRLNWDVESGWIDKNEFDPHWIELELLRKLSPQLYQAKMTDVLNVLADTTFCIEAYKNPDQDLPKLYADIINDCFPDAKQTKNYTYLVKHSTIRAFSGLHHAISIVEILGGQIEK